MAKGKDFPYQFFTYKYRYKICLKTIYHFRLVSLVKVSHLSEKFVKKKYLNFSNLCLAASQEKKENKNCFMFLRSIPNFSTIPPFWYTRKNKKMFLGWKMCKTRNRFFEMLKPLAGQKEKKKNLMLAPIHNFFVPRSADSIKN